MVAEAGIEQADRNGRREERQEQIAAAFSQVIVNKDLRQSGNQGANDDHHRTREDDGEERRQEHVQLVERRRSVERGRAVTRKSGPRRNVSVTPVKLAPNSARDTMRTPEGRIVDLDLAPADPLQTTK